MEMQKYDFSGYVTKNDLTCLDGRIIKRNAFKHNDGQKVPLVWMHQHKDPENVLGHVVLENRDDGVYAYGTFNKTPRGLAAKEQVLHGDIDKLSIFANKLKQIGSNVTHGEIREVSLVLSGANPGAYIDNISMAHAEEGLGQAIIYSGGDVILGETKGELAHANPEEKTVAEIFESMSEEQKNVVYIMLADALEDSGELEQSEKEGETFMKKNVFDQKNEDNKAEGQTLSHDAMKVIFDDAKRMGSLKDSILAHAGTYGIDDIDYLFPDAKTLRQDPEFVKRRTEWVSGVLGGTKHTPFSRIKTVFADITADEARAKGYVTGELKKDEVFGLLKRITTPTTIYKKQKLDRDDIIDITDFNVVAWLKAEMRLMLDEELARAVLISDGRAVDDEDKISETNIRPISKDDDFYSHKVDLATNVSTADIIEAILRSRPSYKGTGTPTMYTTESLLTDMLLLKDKLGRRIYRTQGELETALRVRRIVTVEPMEEEDEVIAILVNLVDYSLGADKGGKISMFDDFDIDYNQHKYLIETRVSGALTRPKSAVIISRLEGTEVTPTDPTFNSSTGVLTVPTKTGVEYYDVANDGTETLLAAGAQAAIDAGASIEVIAYPATDYYFPNNINTTWEFTRASS